MVDNRHCAGEGAAEGGRKQMEGKDLSWSFSLVASADSSGGVILRIFYFRFHLEVINN